MSDIFEGMEELEMEEFSGTYDANRANYATQKLVEARQRFTLYEEAINGSKERLNQQLENARNELRETENYYLPSLDAYLDTVPAKKAKTQISFELPAGKLIRKLPSTKFIKDEKILIDVLNGTEFVESKPNLKWAELKKDLTVQGGVVFRKSTGEVMAGIDIEEVAATFDVK